ncbi:Flp family type IVb pilin [Advenella alkanexedens]|uniref:Flp family type IVb pilin n=1 Tax=Advenella alkanexedens TaxID=1481665 RepID=UPI0026771C4B|nr:Flp family type IVb pilin [Advenella alkanexedens]WKU19609.1 Flp family type IVb pilin [Advenella alkanexedens]
MKDQLIKFWKDEEGATAIEYALIAGLIAVVIIAALTTLGNQIGGMFNGIAEKMKTANTEAGK